MSNVTTGLNAKRNPGEPMRQPLYRFDTIPKCKKNLEGSTIYEVNNREDIVDSMAEMVYVCKEAMRRAKKPLAGKRTSKPLSLEYIADRLDIDDPLRGFFVRDNDSSRLQGYITYTTFTNWQKSFRWDSINESAFCWDDSELVEQTLNGLRKCDDGALSAELQQTVRCGDVHYEGIIWPRIAEISLLGGLGCGKALLSYTIERLETMKAGANYNYDYVVLQATENSISFYESMGFTRVGALTIGKKFDKKIENSGSETETDESDEDVAVNPKPTEVEIISNPNIVYVVEKDGETPSGIAKKTGTDVWDVIFLNQGLYKNLKKSSWLYAGTNLYIPSKKDCKADALSLVSSKKDLQQGSKNIYHWYIAKENETPKSIARKFGLITRDVVRANIERLPELMALSRLKDGTRVRVSNLDQHDDKYIPYSHWTNPEDTGKNIDPSYMMVKKLNRRRPNKLVLGSFPTSEFVAPPIDLFKKVKLPAKMPLSRRNKGVKSVQLPGKPKEPQTAYELFCNDRRKSIPNLARKSFLENAKMFESEWKELDDETKNQYKKMYNDAKEKCKAYEKNLIRFFEKHPEMRPKGIDEYFENKGTLFNQVVTLKSNPIGKIYGDYKYFYVLTYIPDLFWCHLAPMKQVGNWTDENPECEGRPIWRLVEEDEGKELDISADFCTLVHSRQMYRTEDADDERWDILESGKCYRIFSKETMQNTGLIDSFATPTETKEESIAEVLNKRKREVMEKQGSPSKKRKRIETGGTQTTLYNTVCSEQRNTVAKKILVKEGSSKFQPSKTAKKMDLSAIATEATSKINSSNNNFFSIFARKNSSAENIKNQSRKIILRKKKAKHSSAKLNIPAEKKKANHHENTTGTSLRAYPPNPIEGMNDKIRQSNSTEDSNPSSGCAQPIQSQNLPGREALSKQVCHQNEKVNLPVASTSTSCVHPFGSETKKYIDPSCEEKPIFPSLLQERGTESEGCNYTVNRSKFCEKNPQDESQKTRKSHSCSFQSLLSRKSDPGFTRKDPKESSMIKNGAKTITSFLKIY